MARPGIGPGLIAALVAATAVGSVAVMVVTAVVANRMVAPPPATAETTHALVDRENKTDALPAPQAKQERAEIKSVEVVGLRDAAIIYRDRNGNVLFRTDPVANVTVVAKNVDLPEVTIRDSTATKVDRMVVEGDAPPAPPQGCESSFAQPSPVALTRIPSRCLAQAAPAARLAVLP